MGRLEEKVVLITGGSAGIGRATAVACAREGAYVVISDIDEAGAAGTLGMIAESGRKGVFVKTDVTRSADVECLLREVIGRYGKLDCAHNNAGITGPAFITGQYREEDWNSVIGINLTGVWQCMRFELQHMAERGKGVIVNTSSGAGLRGLPYQCAYSASKHAIIGLSRTAAVEYAKKGIRINVLCPGFIDTGVTRQVIAKKPVLEDKYKGLVPVGRLGTEDEVAEAVVWLFSDASSFVTGHALVVDGGASS